MRLPTRTRSWRYSWEDLQPIDYFAGLPVRLLRDAARHVDRVDVPAGERLVRAGTHPGWVWVVAAGILEERPTGQLVLPGAAHCEPEVLLGQQAMADLVAATPATVLSLSSPVFHGLLAEPEFAVAVARRLARTVLARPVVRRPVAVASGW